MASRKINHEIGEPTMTRSNKRPSPQTMAKDRKAKIYLRDLLEYKTGVPFEKVELEEEFTKDCGCNFNGIKQ
jgi:hypothetical protein